VTAKLQHLLKKFYEQVRLAVHLRGNAALLLRPLLHGQVSGRGQEGPTEFKVSLARFETKIFLFYFEKGSSLLQR
jgi:hypothetical protein